jgi:ketosteroid isomerase-like protein
MAKGNVDLVHRSVDAINRRDLEAFTALMDQDVSRSPLRDNAWLVGRWRNGLCVWWQVYRSEVEALTAAGPSE